MDGSSKKKPAAKRRPGPRRPLRSRLRAALAVLAGREAVPASREQLQELAQRQQQVAQRLGERLEGLDHRVSKRVDSLGRRIVKLKEALEKEEDRRVEESRRLTFLAHKIAVFHGERERRMTQMTNRHPGNAFYEHLGYTPLSGPDFNGWEFSVYSQHGEDGLLLHIFDVVGVANRTFVEVSPGDGSECNTLNLALNFGWQGLMVDGADTNMANARTLIDRLLGDAGRRVQTRAAFVTAENINSLIGEAQFSGEIDLLSIDVDGIDFWLWRAVEAVSPRVVVVECNPILGNEPMTVPYDPAFVRRGNGRPPYYHGASPSALQRLGRSLGYCLVGQDSSGTNLFFVRRDLMKPPLAEQDTSRLVSAAAWRLPENLPDGEPAEELPLVTVGEDGNPQLS